MSDLPLKGLKILAPEQMMALPHATQLLALLGAEVLKVEPLGGESGRHGRPMVGERDGSETGSTFVRNNLAKESIAIDPPSPYRERAAYAPIVEAMAGLYEYAREGDDPPRLASAGAIGDTGPGLYAVIGLLSALHQRERTGRGCHVDVSMYDAMIAIADVVHIASVDVVPSLATRGIGIFDSFRASDGWFAVEIVREPHFPRFCEAVGHPEWKEDPRLATRSGWAEHLESVIRPAVEEWARGRGKAEAAAELARHGVAAGPVNTAADIVDDPHVRSRGLVHHFEDPTREAPVHVVGSPLYFGPRGEENEPAPKRWPLVGEQTESVLEAWLGLSPETIETFRKEGVVK
jgi:formyl-CoA transferase